MKIVFTGGGTAGHIFPILAVVREIKRLSSDPKIKLHYIGPADSMSLFLLKQENVAVHSIVAGKIRHYFAFENFVDVLFKIPFGFLQSFFMLLFTRPKLVFSKGGTGSAPVVTAAHMLGIPIFIHESDTVPGKSNRLAYPWAKKVFTSFAKTAYFDLNKTLVTGNPILKEVMEGNKESAKQMFNVTLQRPVILFWGGSQGAEAINDFVLNILPALLQSYEIIHICGKKNHQRVQEEADVIVTKETEPFYHLWEFLDENPLKNALAVADFVVSRAGSGSIFEIAACGKASILIPLPSSANNHQSKNAYEYAITGAAIVVEQENLNPNFFLEKINYLFTSPKEMEAMQQAALKFAKPLAAKAIAREILEYLNIK